MSQLDYIRTTVPTPVRHVAVTESPCMSDEPFYSPTHKPAPVVRKPRPTEPSWELRKDHVTWSAELRFHGESYGWEDDFARTAI